MKRARIKPLDPKKGHHLQRFTHGALGGLRFEAGRWYEVNEDVAAELARVNQGGSLTTEPVPGLPRAFDILEPEAAERLSAEELRVASGGTPMAEVMVPPGREGVQRAVPVGPKGPAEVRGGDLDDRESALVEREERLVYFEQRMSEAKAEFEAHVNKTLADIDAKVAGVAAPVSLAAEPPAPESATEADTSAPKKPKK